MAISTRISKRRILGISVFFFILTFIIVIRIGWLQIVKGDDLKEEALSQWVTGVPISAKRGNITDSNGVNLAITLKRYTVWVRPKDVNDKKKAIKIISEITGEEIENVSNVINGTDVKETSKWIEKETKDKLEKKLNEKKIQGIDLVEDNKRYYPKNSLGSYFIGHTNTEQEGVFGIEGVFNDQLKGKEGKLIKFKDGQGAETPTEESKLYNSENGKNIKLTMDSKIQEITENAVKRAQKEHSPKKTAAIVMNPNTGEILAMTATPSYDLNNPMEVLNNIKEENSENLTEKKKTEKLYEMWGNYNVSEIYEPGSTFKTLMVGAAIEEGDISLKSTFYCDGTVHNIESDTSIRCAIYPGSHGFQTLSEGLKNSCNIMMVDIGLRLKGEGINSYIQDFGFGQKTNIDLQSEGVGIVPSSSASIKNATLANISFGQGLSVTPIQLITAISSIANGGNLMKPQVVKEIKGKDGKVVEEFKPETVRKVISKETADEVLDMMGYTAEEGYKDKFKVEGYRVGAKTGTSQKVINGRYSNTKHIGSFAGVAPLDNPEITVLTIVDEAKSGKYYGIDTAGPIGEEIIKNTMEYLKVGKEKSNKEDKVEVPNLIGMKAKDAINRIKESELDYDIDSYYIDPKKTVNSQDPKAEEIVDRGNFVKLYTD